MDQCTQAVRLNGWRKVVEACNQRPDGMTARQWMAENNISEKAYYYWQRKIRQKAFDDAQTALTAVKQETSVSFAELKIRHSDDAPVLELGAGGFRPDVIIQTSTATFAVSNSASTRILSALLKEVCHAE